MTIVSVNVLHYLLHSLTILSLWRKAKQYITSITTWHTL